MNLDKTSDPYCILRFVDELCVPVSKSNIVGYKTKYVLKTLNPVWNQQLVFQSDSGFLRATYLHIEVWDRDVVTADTCMGEVFIPLKNISSLSTRMNLHLEWSPLMSYNYQLNNSNYGILVIDIRIISATEDHIQNSSESFLENSKYSRFLSHSCQRGQIEFTTTISL